MKKFLTTIILFSIFMTAVRAEENNSNSSEGILYSEKIAKEFAFFNIAFGCAITRDKFYSKQYGDSAVESCVDEIDATPDSVKDRIFEGSGVKKPLRGLPKPQLYSMYDMLIVGKYHFILGCYSAHVAANQRTRMGEEALIEECTEMSDLITPQLIQNFTTHQQKKKTT